MRKLLLVIISFFFVNNVYASNLEYTDTNVRYTLSERIEEEEETEDSGFVQYFILIAVFLGVSALFLILKGNDD